MTEEDLTVEAVWNSTGAGSTVGITRSLKGMRRHADRDNRWRYE
jgi:hypothetical protein